MKTISFVQAFSVLAILLATLLTTSTQFVFARHHHDNSGSSDSNDSGNGGSNDNSGNSGSGSGDNSDLSSSSLDPANGYQDGVNQARADAESGVAMSASCTAHGIDNVGNEQYCINYKAGYLVEQWAYDGRVSANYVGIAGSGRNDPAMTALDGVYTTMWNVYLNEELKYTSTSSFINLNDKAFTDWNWNHVDHPEVKLVGKQLYTRPAISPLL